MMKKALETNSYKISYPDSLKPLVDKTIVLLENKINEYKTFFGLSESEKVIVNYFDNLEEFREFIYEIRGERESLPRYAEGTYDKGMINAYIEPSMQLKKVYTASHELFHILYMKHILKNNYNNRIVWYDEGMAQFMSGEKDNLNDINVFYDYYQKVKENTHITPDINVLKHGDSFFNEQYNGYDLSYLSVRYLSETLNNDEFAKLVSNFDKIKELGNNIIKNAFDFYDEKYKASHK